MTATPATGSLNFKNISFLLALLAMLLGLGGLCGWIFHDHFLQSFIADGATMKVNTALLLLSGGAALMALTGKGKIIARILAVFIILLSVALMVENVTGTDLHIDQLLFKDTLTNPAIEAPGRTSLLTALNALILGIALFTISKNHYRAAQLYAGCTVVIIYISLIGHLFHIAGFYTFGKYSGIAFNTGLGLLAIAIGLLAFEAKRGWVGTVYERLDRKNLKIYFFSYFLGAAPLMGVAYLFVIQQANLSPASDILVLIAVTIILSLPFVYFILRLLSRLGTELTQSDDKLKIALSAANLGIWQIEPNTMGLFYNPTLAKIFGYEGSTPMTYAQAIGQVTEEFRPVITAEIEEAIKNGGEYDITYQQRRFNDGKIIWLRSSGKVSQDAEGNYTVFSGVVMDITDRMYQQQLTQSLNEELATTNEELLTTNEELSESRDNLRDYVTELAASQYRTRNIIESAPFPIGVYTGKEMRIAFANKAIINVWGKGSDVIEKLYAEVLPELDNQAIFTQLDHVFTTGLPFEARNQQLELVVDGVPRIFYFNYNFTALRNEDGDIYGVMNTAADVTDVMQAKAAVEDASDALASLNEELTAANEEQNAVNTELAEINNKYKISQDELQLAINAASLATFDLNPVTNKFTGNDLLKSWFGLQPEDEIELSKATNVIADADRERVIAAIQRSMTYESGGDYDTYYTIINPLNPEPRIVRAKGKVFFNEQHQPIRLSGILQDVTEQKKDEQRKNDFIGMVSHELKTPLTSLTAIVQVLNAKLKESEDKFVAGALDKATLQTKKMSNMINGFLNISRLESGKIQLDKTNFNMDALIENVIAETKLIAAGYELALSTCDNIIVNADQDKIGSVISNLLSNAIKYSARGTRIEVGCTLKGNMIEVSVCDQGIGIKQKDIEHLFDRYYRVNDPNLSHISGFGIGLYLSAEIIQQHRGKIWVTSESGKGSTFYFSLPVK